MKNIQQIARCSFGACVHVNMSGSGSYFTSCLFPIFSPASDAWTKEKTTRWWRMQLTIRLLKSWRTYTQELLPCLCTMRVFGTDADAGMQIQKRPNIGGGGKKFEKKWFSEERGSLGCMLENARCTTAISGKFLM
jgi:hypothetical protein